ncbi:MAG TPA: SWIM zinc finger family protein, partial [Thermoguttaceae bacterium]|nr:SWIM zinc finger family protein [Thermoguttaceae bacterium]
MGDIPTLQDGEIEKRVGSRALRRGWEYFQKGALRQLRRQGKTIHGLCRGTSFEPYRVRVLFNDAGVAEADCSCPIGQGGYCKHVAALLVAWREKPQAFRALEELENALDRCTRRELVEIIKKLLELHPEMEEAVCSWAPKVAADRSPPDAAAYRSQVKALLQQAGRVDPPEWERTAERLWAILEIAEAFASQRESENASVVYRAILEEMLAYEQTQEIFHWPLSRIVDACVEGLEKVLADRETAPDIRTGVLRILLSLLRRNLELFGSLREDVGEVFRRQTTPTEKSLLSQWIESLAGLADSQAIKRLWGGLLLELAGQEVDMDGFARICRTTGRHFDLVRRLVLWGRVEEALQEAQHLAEDELLQLADLLDAAGRSSQAEQLVEKRLADRPQGPLADWIARHRQTQEHKNRLVDLAEQIFRLEPSFEAFLQLRQAARSVGRWDPLRSELLAHLEQIGQWGLLARILLEEKELGRALTLLQTHPAEHLETWETEIAQMAEQLYPAEALEIYRRRVDRLVAQRTPHH